MIINKFITGLSPVHVYFVILSEETIGKKIERTIFTTKGENRLP